jgi:hypothetical protein
VVPVNYRAPQSEEKLKKEQKSLTPYAIEKLMSKSKMPPELLAHFKGKGEKNQDGSEMSDKDKRKAALDKARKYQEQKRKKGKE